LFTYEDNGVTEGNLRLALEKARVCRELCAGNVPAELVRAANDNVLQLRQREALRLHKHGPKQSAFVMSMALLHQLSGAKSADIAPLEITRAHSVEVMHTVLQVQRVKDGTLRDTHEVKAALDNAAALRLPGSNCIKATDRVQSAATVLAEC
jgi:hypothetical protein